MKSNMSVSQSTTKETLVEFLASLVRDIEGSQSRYSPRRKYLIRNSGGSR